MYFICGLVVSWLLNILKLSVKLYVHRMSGGGGGGATRVAAVVLSARTTYQAFLVFILVFICFLFAVLPLNFDRPKDVLRCYKPKVVYRIRLDVRSPVDSQ